MKKENKELQTFANEENLPVEQISKSLEAYGLNQPYDLQTRIQQGKWLLKQEVGVRFALGCILLEIKAHENVRTFGQILTDEFGGMSRQRAYEYMLFARKCMALPNLRAFAEENWSKAIALMHSCSDEELKEINDNKQLLDEYDGMSVRELKQAINHLKTETDKLVSKRVNSLEAENSLLKKRIEELERYVPNPYNSKDNSWAINYIKDIEDGFILIEERIHSMFLGKRSLLVGDPALQSLIEGMYTRLRRRFIRFIHEWEDFTGKKIAHSSEDFWKEA